MMVPEMKIPKRCLKIAVSKDSTDLIWAAITGMRSFIYWAAVFPLPWPTGTFTWYPRTIPFCGEGGFIMKTATGREAIFPGLKTIYLQQ